MRIEIQLELKHTAFSSPTPQRKRRTHVFRWCFINTGQRKRRLIPCGVRLPLSESPPVTNQYVRAHSPKTILEASSRWSPNRPGEPHPHEVEPDSVAVVTLCFVKAFRRLRGAQFSGQRSKRLFETGQSARELGIATEVVQARKWQVGDLPHLGLSRVKRQPKRTRGGGSAR